MCDRWINTHIFQRILLLFLQLSFSKLHWSSSFLKRFAEIVVIAGIWPMFSLCSAQKGNLCPAKRLNPSCGLGLVHDTLHQLKHAGSHQNSLKKETAWRLSSGPLYCSDPSRGSIKGLGTVGATEGRVIQAERRKKSYKTKSMKEHLVSVLADDRSWHVRCDSRPHV